MFKRFVPGFLTGLLLVSVAAFGIAAGSTGALAQGAVPQQFEKTVTTTTYTILPQDCSKFLTFSNGSAVSVTLPQAGTSGFLQGCFFDIRAQGATVTITPTTSTFNNGASSLAITTTNGAHIVTDGTNYYSKP